MANKLPFWHFSSLVLPFFHFLRVLLFTCFLVHFSSVFIIFSLFLVLGFFSVFTVFCYSIVIFVIFNLFFCYFCNYFVFLLFLLNGKVSKMTPLRISTSWLLVASQFTGFTYSQCGVHQGCSPYSTSCTCQQSLRLEPDSVLMSIPCHTGSHLC